MPGSWTARGLHPRSQSLGYGPVKTGLADCFDEQDRTGPGDDLAAVGLNADAGIGPDNAPAPSGGHSPARPGR